AAAPAWWSQLFPPLALVLMLIPLFKLDDISLVFWPCVLLVDLLAIGLALITASLTAVVVVLLLTLTATGVWLFNVPASVAADPATPLRWYLLFAVVFALYPFLFRARFAAMTGPWAISALAGVAQFPLVYHTVERSWPNNLMGLLPGLFAAPPLVSLVAVLRAP